MIKSITSVKVAGRRVILRAGFDVPLKIQNSKIKDQNKWEVADDARIKDVLATLKHLIEQKAKIIIISHLDRPEGWQEEKSLWPAALRLGELLNYKVLKIKKKFPSYDVPHIFFLTEDITQEDYSSLSKKLPSGSILFLENLRFYRGEKEADEKFIELLASFGDLYVSEAFSNAHRKDASMFGLPKILPSYAGISLLKEISSLSNLIKDPKKPFIAIMGGIKISDKVETIHNLAKHAQFILVGGGIANTFQKAMGYEVGKSIISEVHIAKQLLRNYRSKIILPVDLVVATSLTAKPRVAKIEGVRTNEYIFDIGPATVKKFSEYIKTAKTLVWNGPMGKLEDSRYVFGSKSMAYIFASRAKGKAFGVVGGGETVEAVDLAKVGEFIDHISTGGGAMLQFLAGRELPAIKALEGK